MPEGFSIDGVPTGVIPEEDFDRAFAAAMAAPGDYEDTAPAPPKVERDPDAPYGRKADGTPRRKPGRPKHDAPRTTNAPAAGRGAQKPPAAAGKSAAGKDYTRDLTGLVQLGWGVLAVSSPADAGALKAHGPGMVEAWNAAAQENAYVARGIEWLTKGGVWGAVLMSTAPFALQVMANHGRLAVDRVAALGVKDPAVLARETASDLHAMAGDGSVETSPDAATWTADKAA